MRRDHLEHGLRRPGGDAHPWFDPSAQDPELTAELQRQTAREEVLLLGRRTFEDFRGYWPQQTADTNWVAHALLTAQLVDGYRMFLSPAWQARGRSFFPHGYATAAPARSEEGRRRNHLPGV